MKVGKILISFNILEYEIKIPREIVPFNPPSERYTVKIRILGLRNLKSQGILSVQKPFLKFDVNGLKPMGLKDQKALIVTSKEGGTDPNISTIVRFEVDLPLDPNLCPSLSCLVFDTVWEGVIQPILGCFAIDLGQILANDPNLRPKAHKIQSGFIEQHPMKLLGEADESDIIIDIEGEKMALLSKDKVGKKIKEKPDKKEDEIHQITESLIKKVKKYPTVLSLNGQLHQEYIIIKPKYVQNQKKQFMTEKECPDPELYLPLDHDKREDKIKNQTKKHYRYYLNQELEKTSFMNQNLFNQYYIYKGKRFVEEDFFEAFSLDQKYEEVGLFKGWVDIYRGEEVFAKEQAEENDSKDEELDALILKTNDFVVRVYIIDALNLQPMDDDSLSDPYVRLVLGSTKIDVFFNL